MIRTDQYSRTCVLSVEGDLAGEDAATARRIIEDVLSQAKVTGVVIDFGKVEFIDSAGLESLLWTSRQCEGAGKRLKLVSLDEHCRKILEVTRLSSHFECYSDVAAAMKN